MKTWMFEYPEHVSYVDRQRDFCDVGQPRDEQHVVLRVLWHSPH